MYALKFRRSVYLHYVVVVVVVAVYSFATKTSLPWSDELFIVATWKRQRCAYKVASQSPDFTSLPVFLDMVSLPFSTLNMSLSELK